MALKDDAKYQFSVKLLQVTPLNDDLSQPTPDNIIGGAGPFDFSGASVIAAVPFISKIDSDAEEAITVDLSGAADDSAVTGAELFAAINTATPTDLTASLEAETERVKIIYSGAGSPTYLQIYGECAELGLFGQGKGVKIVVTNTQKSFSETPILKDEETFTTTDSNGIDTEILTDGYRKGVGGTFVDTATDYNLRSIFEGGVLNGTTGGYSVPTSTSGKVYFKIEVFTAVYTVGTQKERDLTSYLQTVVFSAKGSYGDSTRDRNFTDANYNYTATSPKIAGVITPDTDYIPLTVEEFVALNLESVAA